MMKQVLLTDEERELTIGVSNIIRNNVLLEDKLLKAQLKKVAEWLDGFTFYNDALGESAKSFKRRIKDMLLKEIE